MALPTYKIRYVSGKGGCTYLSTNSKTEAAGRAGRREGMRGWKQFGCKLEAQKEEKNLTPSKKIFFQRSAPTRLNYLSAWSSFDNLCLHHTDPKKEMCFFRIVQRLCPVICTTPLRRDDPSAQPGPLCRAMLWMRRCLAENFWNTIFGNWFWERKMAIWSQTILTLLILHRHLFFKRNFISVESVFCGS